MSRTNVVAPPSTFSSFRIAEKVRPVCVLAGSVVREHFLCLHDVEPEVYLIERGQARSYPTTIPSERQWVEFVFG